MNPENQRMAIAEILGWKRVGMFEGCRGLMGELPPCRGWIELPDWPFDLNDCHRMEQDLTFEQAGKYERLLLEVATPKDGSCPPPSYGYTAAQRSEAFLRLHAKWQD